MTHPFQCSFYPEFFFFDSRVCPVEMWGEYCNNDHHGCVTCLVMKPVAGSWRFTVGIILTIKTQQHQQYKTKKKKKEYTVETGFFPCLFGKPAGFSLKCWDNPVWGGWETGGKKVRSFGHFRSASTHPHTTSPFFPTLSTDICFFFFRCAKLIGSLVFVQGEGGTRFLLFLVPSKSHLK